MEQSDDNTIDLLERAQFGKQIEAFWNSQIGNYLRTRARECYTSAIVRLKNADATDVRAVMEAQNDAKVAEWFEDWLAQGIQDGITSLNILQGKDDEIS